MTWAIFCLLALRAFQIVFAANLADDIAASYDTSTVPMINANIKAYADILVVADTVKNTEITSGQMYNICTKMSNNADKKFDDIYKTKRDKCQQCYHKARNTKDIQNAENCCKKIAEEFKKDVKSFMTQAKTCIADLAEKCSKSATYCRKEATNADKDYDKSMKEIEENFTKMFGN